MEKEVQRTDVRGKMLDNGRGTKAERETIGHGGRTMAERGKIKKGKETWKKEKH